MKSPASHLPSDWIASIFAESHIAIGISSTADGRFVAVNDAFERLFGYKRKSILGHTSLELGLWPNPEERRRLMAMLSKGKPVQGYEAQFRTRSGAIGDLRVSASFVTFENKRFMVGLLTDITEHKRAERAVRMNKARIDTMLKLSELAVFHQDRRLRYTWIANPALGVGQDDVIGRSDEDIVGRQAARPLTALKRGVLRSGRGERQEVWVSNKGQTGCFDLIVEPEHAADGRITGIVCAAVDITSRKRAEEKLQLQADILENLEEGVNMVDTHGLLRYTNPKFDAMFGYAPGELLGRPAAILNAPGSATPEQTAQAILGVLRREGRWSGKLRNRRKDGSEFWTQANIVATLHPKYGEIWISVQSDITALHEAEEDLRAAYRALGRLTDHAQDAIEAQRLELAREVHDEIGATLTGIRIHLDKLAQEGCCGELGRIRQQIDAALATTRALASRLRPPILDDLGLVETLRWYVHDWSRQTGIRTTVRIASLATEPADPLRIDIFRMLQELLTNVARHAGATQVRVALTTPRGALQLRVADDGRGIAAEAESGYGLLGIRERLRRHDGTMSVASPPGTTVTLHLPRAAP